MFPSPCVAFFLFFTTPGPLKSAPFPYTTLFRFGAWFAAATVIVAVAEVPLAPLLSYATAVTEYVPAATEDQANVYGATASELSSVVSLYNSTRAVVPSASVAVALRVTAAGAVKV